MGFFTAAAGEVWMKDGNFTRVSEEYGKRAVVQAAASFKLAGLLEPRRGEEVLDLGCGSGEITARLAGETGAEMHGCDPSEGMIAKARERFPEIGFAVSAAEDLSATEAYDAIFCNSAFQWFRDPASALSRCRNALKRGGRIGIQAPAGNRYCPNFIEAVSALSSDARTAETWAGFRSPWLFLETVGHYRDLFVGAGFRVDTAYFETTASSHSPKEAFEIFRTGAGVGYLDPASYGRTSLPSPYIEAALGIVGRSLAEGANPDVELEFTRIYLIAFKD
jgi:trans-aconitate methyltransferase